ncbi:hypothetical protein [Streptomyces sp. NBC_00118]|uniref:hypothetical protein n=1 Tax=Streptomyces sp. NBC_00118 TaxID=2975658 RepID=UPI00324C1251
MILFGPAYRAGACAADLAGGNNVSATKLRTDPARATSLLRALLVLTDLEVNR